jgi:hypothetical protein
VSHRPTRRLARPARQPPAARPGRPAPAASHDGGRWPARSRWWARLAGLGAGRARVPGWLRWLACLPAAGLLTVPLGRLPVLALTGATLGLRFAWGRLDRLERTLGIAGLGTLLALLRPYPLASALAVAALGLAVWWLSSPPPAPAPGPEPPGEEAQLAAEVFAAVRHLLGAPTLEQAYRTETNAEYAARGGHGERATIPFQRPPDPADYVRVHLQRDPDGTIRLDEHGRPVVEAVRLRCRPTFERAQRGQRLQRQLEDVLTTRTLADWRTHNRPIFRRVPDLPTHIDHAATRAVLALVGPTELVLGPTDPDSPFARELAGTHWLVVNQDEHPNVLVVGRIGFGKSTAGRHLAAWLLAQGAELLVADGKGGEFTYLAGRPGVLAVAHAPADILALAAWHREELDRRKDLVETAARRGRPLPEFRPLMLVTDEHKLIVDQLGPELARAYNEHLAYTAVGGRRDRIWSIHMLQRPAAGTSSDLGLPTLIRANMSIKVGMGPLDRITAEMVYEDADLPFPIEAVSGRAGVLIGRTFSRIQTPWLPNLARLTPGSLQHRDADRWLPAVTGSGRSRPAKSPADHYRTPARDRAQWTPGQPVADTPDDQAGYHAVEGITGVKDDEGATGQDASTTPTAPVPPRRVTSAGDTHPPTARLDLDRRSPAGRRPTPKTLGDNGPEATSPGP